MNEQTQKLLSELAVKFGTTAEHLWGVLIRQAGIEAWVHTIVAVALIILVVSAWIALKWNFKRLDEGEFEPMFFIILTIVSLLVVIFFIATVADDFTQIMNPEFWAMKKLKPC